MATKAFSVYSTTSQSVGNLSQEHAEHRQHEFLDLDDPVVLRETLVKLNDGGSKNFVLDFSDQSAHVNFNVNATNLRTLLDAPRCDMRKTRWVNVWNPFKQKTLLATLARRYDFSPRLLALMCSDPTLAKNQDSCSRVSRHSHKWSWGHSAPSRSDADVENGSDELTEHSSIYSSDNNGSSNIYWILDDIWHYSSLDFGRSYICVGYNTLYGTKNTGDGEGSGPLPYCTRVWTWLVICEDNTIISINEDSFPQSDGVLTTVQKRILTETRRNLGTIFRSLSTVDELPMMAKNPMTVLPIRHRLGNTPEETAHRDSDAPGLLFYYLFENWQNSYTLVTRKESRYGVELETLRKEMLCKPQLNQINRLDGIGKELGVLRRHYESYNRIIVRLLEPVRRSDVSLANSFADNVSRTSLDAVKPALAPKESKLGVSLSAAACVRFKRLKDMIDLYALCEVEEYIKQKDSLVQMNFNLIAIKQSTDVERLTRVTLLLTKATMLFLPVSLMTSYFDVSLSDVQYTVQQYWIAFGIIFCASFVCMAAFGVFSGSMQASAVWRSIRNTNSSAWRRLRRVR